MNILYFEFFTKIETLKCVKCLPVPELSSDDMYVKVTMVLMMALDKAEIQGRLDTLDQAVDSLCYLFGSFLYILSCVAG